MDDDEREADRILKESGPMRERHKVMMAATRLHRRVLRGETPEPVTVDDTTIRYDPDRPGSGIVIRDFLGREHTLEEWLPVPPSGDIDPDG